MIKPFLNQFSHLYGTQYAYNINSVSQIRTRTNFSVYLENSDVSPPDSSLMFNKEYTFTRNLNKENTIQVQ